MIRQFNVDWKSW